MIVTAILYLLYGVVRLIISPIFLFSDVSLSGNFGTSITTAGGYLHAINTIVPVDTMLVILGVSLVFEGYYLTFKALMWVLKKIPTIN